ncbi:uncharacterized protein LOC114579729, partial [Dendrobium catenatum]|uniref:uncharacterized protein LOC114579729 n=1 Tax=Dendrobium catenatum TaxID=906689 RepID=UPI0010A0ACF8
MSSTLFWNCRGARKKCTGNYLRHLVGDNDIHFIGLVETKVENLERSEVDRLIGTRWDFFHLPSVGKSGGILVLWRRDLATFQVLAADEQVVVGALSLPGGQRWTIAVVYANKDYLRRRELWQLVSSFCDSGTPILVGGDFNVCLDQSEKKGGKRVTHSAGVAEMMEFMGCNDLHDLGFVGPKYTWTNNKEGNSRIWVRLDRVLMSSDGLRIAPFATVRHMGRVASDHSPLLLTLTVRSPVKMEKWIRFEDVWTTFPSSWRVVWQSWRRNDFGSPAEIINRKCHRTLRALFHWSKHRVRDLTSQKAALERRILDLQELDCAPAGLNEEQEAELRRCIGELNDTLTRLTIWWRQRAKTRWLEEGDANSHFFHLAASGRRRENRISNIVMEDGRVVSDPDNINEAFLNFFKDKWRARDTSLVGWPTFAANDGIPDNFHDLLVADVTEEEIWEVVRGMGNNRAPGRDGITTSFLKFYWNLIKSEVVDAIRDFFTTNFMDAHWKETLIILIPKVVNADSPAKFRPISLCQSLYKVVAKILVGRMKPVLAGIIGEEQGAFVPGRSISQHGLLAQEIICNFQHSTKAAGLMALKVDMEQAYDCMAWNTLERVMMIMGFPQQFITWVIRCISFPKFQLLINGCRTDWINGASGFRQGCPLSPYLFILCSELLTKAISQHRQTLGVRIVRQAPIISHLLYADDVLVFAEANGSNAKCIKKVLDNYCGWTGQRINCAKSAVLFSKKCPLWKQRRIARELDFRRVQCLEYLGLQLAMRRLVAADFAKVVGKVTEKVNVWGKRHLSLAGRSTLIRTALLTTPMYLMTHTVIPKGVRDTIERMARRFLWQKDANKRGLHYVQWKELCRPMSHGGLGFHASSTWQGPLRARLAWDFLRNGNSLLARTVTAKYGRNLWCAKDGRNVSCTWKILQDGALALRPIIYWHVGNGSDISVLHDAWITNRSLANWPTFVDIEAVEDCTVRDLFDEQGRWRAALVLQYFGEILGNHIIENLARGELGIDRPELINLPLGTTVTALAYKATIGEMSYQYLWLRKLKLHPREHMFWWRLLLDAVPTNTWLKRRGLTDLEDCPWGCNRPETTEHLAVHCGTLELTLNILNGWGFFIPQFNSWNCLLEGLAHSASNNPSSGRLLCCVIYQCWRARNDKSHGRSFGTPTVIAATVLAMQPKPYSSPAMEQWHTSQPFGLPPNRLWCAPPPKWVKFNVDASVKPNAVAGLGMVARDHLGRLLFAVGKKVEQWDATRAEITAGLLLQESVQGWMYDLDGIIIEGDSHNAIQWLQSSFDRLNKLHLQTEGPDLTFLLDFRQVLFQHLPRASNAPADFCAHMACFGDFYWDNCNITDVPPSFLSLWSPSVTPNSLHGLHSPIWIRLPQLPLIYWDVSNITRIANMLGDPMWMDSHTSSWGRSSFARICVRIDLSQQLLPGIWINGIHGRFFQKIEYEGLTNFCFDCGYIGHAKGSCTMKRASQGPSPTPTPTPRPPPAQPEGSPQHIPMPSSAENNKAGSHANEVVRRMEDISSRIISPYSKQNNRQAVVFNAERQNTETDPTTVNLSKRQHKASKAFMEKQLLQLGPIATLPRKRRKNLHDDTGGDF